VHERTAVSHPLLYRIKSVLPSPHSIVGRDSVFEYAKFAPGTNDASKFAKGIDGLGDSAQREGNYASVAGVVVQLQQRSIKATPSNGNFGLFNLLCRTASHYG
jgi:hypothetical protein